MSIEITKRQKYWLEIITKAGGVCKHYSPLGTENFFVLNTRKVIRVGMFSRMLKAGLLVPQNDGLFGDSQTYVPAKNI